jgi:hypothetical protein
VTDTITSIDTITAEIETMIETARRDIDIGTATARRMEKETETETVIEIEMGIEKRTGIGIEMTIAVADTAMEMMTMIASTRGAAAHATRMMATGSRVGGAIEKIGITSHQTKRPICLFQTRRNLQTKTQTASQRHWSEMLG